MDECMPAAHIVEDCNKMTDLIIVKCHHNLARHIKNRHPYTNIQIRDTHGIAYNVFTCSGTHTHTHTHHIARFMSVPLLPLFLSLSLLFDVILLSPDCVGMNAWLCNKALDLKHFLVVSFTCFFLSFCFVFVIVLSHLLWSIYLLIVWYANTDSLAHFFWVRPYVV